MGHKISKEQIDPGVKDHIMSFVGDIADLETEVNTDIISAVNSLMVDRVDNAENMGKLANAIGEPVTANHSVDEVVEGLGEMLSTFKTNMMNSGVMVESSDKFKQLIDKIKGLTEGEGNKGIRFAEGVHAVNNNIPLKTTYIVDDINLDFTPTYIFAVTDFKFAASDTSAIFYNYIASNFDQSASRVNFDGNVFLFMKISEISSTSFTLSRTDSMNGDNYYGQIAGDIKWYAIGVGEEDTTLRDSLASILTEEGVSVTEEDDMASLITKVDEEFENMNNRTILTYGSDKVLFTDEGGLTCASKGATSVQRSCILTKPNDLNECFCANLRFVASTSSYPEYNSCTLHISQLRNGVLIKSMEIYTNCSSDEIVVNDIEFGDEIQYYMEGTGASNACTIRLNEFSITYYEYKL